MRRLSSPRAAGDTLAVFPHPSVAVPPVVPRQLVAAVARGSEAPERRQQSPEATRAPGRSLQLEAAERWRVRRHERAARVAAPGQQLWAAAVAVVPETWQPLEPAVRLAQPATI
jgi:hypothetical protein